eukprot:2320624-Rhodomonas_salina.1
MKSPTRCALFAHAVYAHWPGIAHSSIRSLSPAHAVPALAISAPDCMALNAACPLRDRDRDKQTRQSDRQSDRQTESSLTVCSL